MRIDKFFSELGLLSRSECKKAVRSGLIEVNGTAVRDSGAQIDPEKDQVFYKGSPVRYSSLVYYMLYKPAGCVTANEDAGHKTVFDYVPDKRPGLSAVGRLDKDTTGILLITDDGLLNHRLLSSKYHVPKTYIAKVSGCIKDTDLAPLKTGIDIGDETPTLPAEAEIIDLQENFPESLRYDSSCESLVSITITEGRYHQIKRMLSKIGYPVIELHRMSFGGLKLSADMKPGDIRELTEEEVSSIRI